MQTNHRLDGPSTLSGLLAQSLALGLLWLAAIGLPHVQCWGLMALSVMLAWPIWVYGSEVHLFERRLWLEQVTRPQSGVRRWLWSGGLIKVIQAPASIVMAIALILLGARLDALHWSVIAANLLILSLLVRPVRRALSGQVKATRVGLVARRWPLLGLNMALLTLAFAALEFFLTAAPDTRGGTWHALVESAFRAEGLDALCAPAGWARGTLAAAETLVRHAAQIAIPGLPDRSTRILAWALVLAHAGALAYLLTRLQLGVICVLERRGTGAARDDPMGLAFLYTILALAIPYLYASSRLAHLDPAALAEQARRAMAQIDPCKPDPTAQAALLVELSTELEHARLAARAQANRRIDRGLDTVFAEIEPGVDRYLDWYFTVLGEYQRLAALATGDFVALMAKELDRHLFQDTGFAERLASLGAEIDSASERTLVQSAASLEGTVQARASRTPCAIGPVDLTALGLGTLSEVAGLDLDRDAAHAGVSAGAGAATAVVTAKLLAKQSGAAVAAKLTGTKGFQTAAALAGKVAAKKGGSILLSAAGATALCSPGGPAAALCGIAAGAITWLAVDKAMVEIDEARLREDMRSELLEALEAQQTELAQIISLAQGEAIDSRAAAIQSRLEQTFIPARDGI